MSSTASESSTPDAREFHTTHWSIVLSAKGDSSGTHASLSKLCAAYWYPLYAFVRRQGVSMHDAEERYALEPADDTSAEKLFDRCWAYQLLDRVLAWGRLEFEASGNKNLFGELKAARIGDAAPYAEIAARLGASESAVKAAAHRLRLRSRELPRAEIAETVRIDGDAKP